MINLMAVFPFLKKNDFFLASFKINSRLYVIFADEQI
jgi:hypothetical protein